MEPRGAGRSLPRREGAPRLMGWGGSNGGAGLAEDGGGGGATWRPLLAGTGTTPNLGQEASAPTSEQVAFTWG